MQVTAKEKKSLLPVEKSKINSNPKDITTLIYGKPKIGKSTFCSKFPNALYIATEAGLNHLEVFKADIKNWDDFIDLFVELAKKQNTYETLIVDTADNLFKFCREFILKLNNIDHEDELQYGKGYALVQKCWDTAINKLCNLGYGVVFVSHAENRDEKTRTGTVSKVYPTLPKRAGLTITSLVDVILYCDVEEHEGKDGKKALYRVLRTKPTDCYEAGDRTGKLPDTLLLDYDKYHEFLTKQKEVN